MMTSDNFTIKLPYWPKYIPNSGPPVSKPTLVLENEDAGYFIADTVLYKGIEGYVVSATDNHSYRKFVHKVKALDWVSAQAIEDYELQLFRIWDQAQQHKEQEEESQELNKATQKFQTQQNKRRVKFAKKKTMWNGDPAVDVTSAEVTDAMSLDKEMPDGPSLSPRLNKNKRRRSSSTPRKTRKRRAVESESPDPLAERAQTPTRRSNRNATSPYVHSGATTPIQFEIPIQQYRPILPPPRPNFQSRTSSGSQSEANPAGQVQQYERFSPGKAFTNGRPLSKISGPILPPPKNNNSRVPSKLNTTYISSSDSITPSPIDRTKDSTPNAFDRLMSPSKDKGKGRDITSYFQKNPPAASTSAILPPTATEKPKYGRPIKPDVPPIPSCSRGPTAPVAYMGPARGDSPDLSRRNLDGADDDSEDDLVNNNSAHNHDGVNNNNNVIADDDDDDDDDVQILAPEEVEWSVLSLKKAQRRISATTGQELGKFYLVEWEGSWDDSWEPEANIDSAALKVFHDRHPWGMETVRVDEEGEEADEEEEEGDGDADEDGMEGVVREGDGDVWDGDFSEGGGKARKPSSNGERKEKIVLPLWARR
jgi:hypothetical protein